MSDSQAKKLSLTKKTLRNLNVRTGARTGGTIAYVTGNCNQVSNSLASTSQVGTADCNANSGGAPDPGQSSSLGRASTSSSSTSTATASFSSKGQSGAFSG